MKQKIIYRVYGEDRFEHESYVVGDYNTRSEADIRANQCRKDAHDQPADLRDSFWVAQLTPEQAAVRDGRGYEEDVKHRKTCLCDEDILRNDVVALLTDIKEQIKDKPLAYRKNEYNFSCDASCEIRNDSKKICYYKIGMCVETFESGGSKVEVNISIRNTILYSGVKYSESEQGLRTWLDSDSCTDDIVKAMNRLVDSYFDF